MSGLKIDLVQSRPISCAFEVMLLGPLKQRQPMQPLSAIESLRLNAASDLIS